MNRSSFRHAFVAATLTVAAAVGCQKPANNSATAVAPANTAQPTPEESFAMIVETFRRGVEDVPIGFVVQDGSGSQTMMTGRNTVTHELFPPAKQGDPFKAVIKVNSESRYSLQRSTEEPNTGDANQASDNSNADSLADGSDVQIFDPAVASAPGANGADRRTTTPKAEKNAVAIAPPVENIHERAYHLVYENGRWKLVTELDPKTEGSIQLAFDRALESQS
jgi:hypothetical protein